MSEVCEISLYNQGFTVHDMGKVEVERLGTIFLACKRILYEIGDNLCACAMNLYL